MSRIIDRSAPGIRITALPSEKASDGTPVALGGRVIGFTYEDCEAKADRVSLQLDNFDLNLFEREELMGGAIIEVSWGYPGNMAPPRRAVVKKVKGFTTLTVEAHALSTLMNQEVKSRTWEGVTRAFVARQIAEGHGFQGEFLDVQETDETFDVINQAAETDARFLKRLASREGFDFIVDHTGFHFRERRQDTPPAQVLTWYTDPERGDILSIDVESDLTTRAGRVTVKGRDPLAKTTIESSTTSADSDRATLGDVVEVVDPETGTTTLEKRNATRVVRPTSAATIGRAKRESAARFRRAERATVKLSMRVVGDPMLAAKQVIELRGVPPRLSGKYYAKQVRHVIASSGYVCDLKLTRDSKGRVPTRQEREQGGEKNTHEPVERGALKPVEVVDPETGAIRIEYRQP
jgi:uncharacterized protein